MLFRSPKETVYRVRTEPTWPPFEMIDETTKEETGFDIELIKAIADIQGFKIEIESTSFDGLITGIANGTFDIGASAISLYHDPLVSYYGLMQVLMIEFCWAMTLWIDFLRSGRKGRLVGSLVFFMIGLLMYEMFYPLLLIFIMTAVFERKSVSAGLRAAWGHLLITEPATGEQQ